MTNAGLRIECHPTKERFGLFLMGAPHTLSSAVSLQMWQTKQAFQQGKTYCQEALSQQRNN